MGSAVGYYSAIARKYADDVLKGDIPACKWTKAACQRQVDDLEVSNNDPSYQYEFFEDQADHVCKFIELLPHVKGKWAGTRIQLEPWQIFILTTVFGWYNKNGYRRFRKVYIEVPRKNAKSTLTGAIALYMLTADGEPGAEIYSSATTSKQARIVFESAQQMTRNSPGFRGRFGVKALEHSISETNNNSKFTALAAQGETLDGLNPHFASVDEFHAHKKRDVYDVLETAMGARSQPILWAITTAGDDRSGICYEQRLFIASILNTTLMKHEGLGYPVKGSALESDSYFGIIYTIDEDDDWTDTECWQKANPNYGVSVYTDSLKIAAQDAKKTSGAINNFLTKHLDVWVNSSKDWMDMRKWENCADTSLKIEDFKGEKCWVGMDLAEKKDFAAIVAIFWREDSLYAFPYLYLNNDAIEESANSQMVGWRADGHIIGNDGDVTDFENIKKDLLYIDETFDLQEVPFDPAMGRYFVTKLTNDYDLPMVEMKQGGVTFTSSAIELENLVLEKKLFFNGNPALTWMMSNVVMSEPSKFTGLRSPHKDNAAKKIDGVIALLMALSRASLEKPDAVVEQGFVSWA